MTTLLSRPRTGSDHNDNGSDVMDRTNSERSDRSDRDNNTSNINLPKAPYDVDDSFRSNNSIDDDQPAHRPNVLSRATILISRRGSSNHQDGATTGGNGNGIGDGSTNFYHSRRSTTESNPLSEAADTSTDIHHNHNTNGIIVGGGVDLVPIIQSSQLYKMGEDQKGNFAPRKSVGDLTAGYELSSDDDDVNDALLLEDRSIIQSDRGPKSVCSEMSGLFISGDEESILPKNNNSRETNQQQQQQQQLEEMLSTHLPEMMSQTHLLQLDETSLRSSNPTNSRDAFHSILSDSHTEGSCTEGSLIVGFGPKLKSISKKRRSEEEDETRGFAADFSAWDNR